MDPTDADSGDPGSGNRAGDELERRLREVLRSDHLAVGPDPDALSQIRDGARRKQRRRAVANSAAGIAVVAVVASVFALRPHSGSSVTADNHQQMTVLASASATSPATSLAAPTMAPKSTLEPSSPAPGISATTVLGGEHPAGPSPLPLMSGPNAANAPTTFTPLSVSAISTNDFWVLGFSTTTYADETASAGVLAHTTDGGGSFAIDHPDLPIANPLMRQPPGMMFVSNVRFGDANDGWAYGAALYSTNDGGSSWSAVDGIPGAVVDLVAANGVAWAVVDLSQTGIPTPPPSPDPNVKYAIYSTSYGNSRQHWTRVVMPFDLGAAQPSIVDQNGTVTMLISGPLRDGYHDHVLLAAPGKAFTDYVGPCFQDLPGSLSNSEDAIWAVCTTGNMASVFESYDAGRSWRQVPAGGSNAIEVGAITANTAILASNVGDPLALLHADGTRSPVDVPDTAIETSFIGFTNPTTGFAVESGDQGPTELWRTTDGGLRWSVVQL